MDPYVDFVTTAELRGGFFCMQSQLGTWKIRHDRQRTSHLTLDITDAANGLHMSRRCSVTEIQPEHIRSSLHQSGDVFDRAARGPQGGDDASTGVQELLHHPVDSSEIRTTSRYWPRKNSRASRRKA